MPTSLLPNPANVRINSGLPDPANIRIVKENLPEPSNIRIVSPIPQPLPEPSRQEQLAKESNDYGFNLLTGTASEAGKEAYNLAKKTFSPFDIRNVTDPIAEVLSREVMSGKPPIQAYKDMGKGVVQAGYDTLQGLSHAVGDPLGTTDIASGDLTFPTARQAWTERPYESAVGVSPILAPLLMKGIGAIPRRQPEIKISPEAKQAYTSGIQEIGQTLKNIPDQARPAQARVVADLRNQMRSALFKNDVATINSIVADFREGQTIPTAQQPKPTLNIPEINATTLREKQARAQARQKNVIQQTPEYEAEMAKLLQQQPEAELIVPSDLIKELLPITQTENIFKQIANITSNVKIDKSFLDHFDRSEVMPITRKSPGLFSTKKGMPLDEIADGLGISTDDLADKIRNAVSSKEGVVKSREQIQRTFEAAPVVSKLFESEPNIEFPFGENVEQPLPKPENVEIVKPTVAPKMEADIQGQQKLFQPKEEVVKEPSLNESVIREMYEPTQASKRLINQKKEIAINDEEARKSLLSKSYLANPERNVIVSYTDNKGEPGQADISFSRLEEVKRIIAQKGARYEGYYEKTGEIVQKAREGILPTKRENIPQRLLEEIKRQEISYAPREDIVSEPKEEYRHAGLPIPSIIKSFAKLPGIEKIVGFFDPLKGLSPEANIAYQNIRNKEKGREARVQRFVMNQFDRLSEMPTEAREQMFHALTSRESITKLPKEYWRKAESLRSLHKYMGQMAVKRGLLSPETYAANKGEWVKLVYEKYMEEKKESLNKQQSSMTMQLDWKKRKLPDTSFGIEEQKARGLKEDVATAVPVGMTEVFTDLSRSDMFDEILKNPELTWQPSVVSVDNGQGGLETWSIGNLQKHIESQGQAVLRNPDNVAMKTELARLQGIMEQAQKESGNVPKGYTQLPSTPAYGKLAGAFVKDAVARDIMPALAMFGKGTSQSEFYNAVQKVMTKGMATFKASKVALNLPSWFRNGGADVIMFNMKGTPLYEIPYWLERSAVEMMKGTIEHTQAFRQGLFRTKYSDVEINNFLGTSRKLLGQDYSGITETLSGAANLYGKIDDWFKFAIYLEERSKGADVATAVRQANKWGMDYSLVHPAIKIARQSLVPFASFNYKFVPLFAETAAQRPWIMAKYMAIPFIMLKAVQAMYGMDDEDVRKLVLSLPSYVRKQKTLLPLPHMSPEGNLEWVDMGYFLPWNTEIQAYKAIEEKDMGGMLRTIGIGNPFLDIYALAKSGHQGDPPRNPYNGQEIYNRLDSMSTKLFKLLEYNYNLFAPGMATRYGAAGKITEIGKKDKYGRTVTPLQAMLRFIGVNIIAPSKEQGRIEKVAKIKELQSALYKGFRDARGDKGKQKQLRESFKEKRRKILSGED